MTTALSTAYVMKGLHQVAGAPVAEERWVSVDCGMRVVKADTAVASRYSVCDG
jgi:hypothetical protein